MDGQTLVYVISWILIGIMPPMFPATEIAILKLESDWSSTSHAFCNGRSRCNGQFDRCQNLPWPHANRAIPCHENRQLEAGTAFILTERGSFAIQISPLPIEGEEGRGPPIQFFGLCQKRVGSHQWRPGVESPPPPNSVHELGDGDWVSGRGSY